MNFFHIRKGSWLDRIFHRKFQHYLLFPIVLVYYEILLRLFTRTPFWRNLFYPVIFAVSFGLLISAVLALFRRRITWHLSYILMAVIAFYYGLEAVLRNTYQTYMTIRAVFTEMGHVAGNFGGDLANGIKGAVPVIILYYIPLVLYLLRGRQQMPGKRYRPMFALFLLLVCLGLEGIGVLCASHLPSVRDKYAAKYEFDTSIRTFGLATGTRLNLKYSILGNPKATSFVVQTETADNAGDSGVSTSGIDVEVGIEEASVAVTDEVVSTEAVVDYGYNVMNIDFDELIAETSDEEIRSIHEYVNSLTPSNKNEYTGLFEGKNLITICAEAFSMQVINEDLTPTLYRLANEGIKFTNFYQPAWGGSTTTGEYALLLGLVPTHDISSMLDTVGDNMYFTTGNQFQRLGYTSLAYHNGNNEYYDRELTHPNLGYDSYLAWGNGLEDLLEEWSQDNDTFRATLETYIDRQPFNVYYMTMSGHCTYDKYNPLVEENYEEVKAYYGDTYKETTLYYFCYQLELEKALTTMVDMLEEAGIADDTVIVLCADHYPYGLGQSSTFNNSEDYLLDLYKVDSYDGFVRDKTALIIWSGSIEGMGLEVDTPTSSLDVLPTLSNLFGLEYDSRLLVGRDVFSDDEPLVMWADYSFLTEKGWYNADTGVFLPTTDEEVDDEYIARIETIVQNKIAFSAAVPRVDYYGILFGEDDVK